MALDAGTTDNTPSSSSSGQSSSAPAATAAPASAAASLAKAEAAGADPSSAQPTGAAAGVLPAPTTGATGQGAPVGEAPEFRIQAAVRNAREELTKKLGWAEGLDQNDVKIALGIIAQLRSDPRSFATQLMSEIADERDAPEPEPDLISEDGKHRAYSAALQKQIWDIREKRLKREFKGELSPLQQSEAGRQQFAQRAAIMRNAQAVAKDALTEIRKQPHFTKENEPAIAAKLNAIDPQVRQTVGSVAALYMAYNQFLAEKVFPTIASTTEQDVITDMQRKAAASAGGVRPASNGGAKPKVLRNERDLAEHLQNIVSTGAGSL